MGLAHVVLHLTLCRGAAGTPPAMPLPITLHMVDVTGRLTVDKSFSVGANGTQTFDFDVPADLYRAKLDAPSLNCSFTDYWPFVSDNSRTIDATLGSNGDQGGQPMIFLGTAPANFVALKPTFALIRKDTACNAIVYDELPTKVRIEDDGTAFFAWVYPNQKLAKNSGAFLALKVTFPNGRTHYVPLKVLFPQPWEGFPTSYNLEVTDYAIPMLSEQPSDTLVCTRILETRGGQLTAPPDGEEEP